MLNLYETVVGPEKGTDKTLHERKPSWSFRVTSGVRNTAGNPVNVESIDVTLVDKDGNEVGASGAGRILQPSESVHFKSFTGNLAVKRDAQLTVTKVVANIRNSDKPEVLFQK